jgi:hypothetical protein
VEELSTGLLGCIVQFSRGECVSVCGELLGSGIDMVVVVIVVVAETEAARDEDLHLVRGASDFYGSEERQEDDLDLREEGGLRLPYLLVLVRGWLIARVLAARQRTNRPGPNNSLKTVLAEIIPLPQSTSTVFEQQSIGVSDLPARLQHLLVDIELERCKKIGLSSVSESNLRPLGRKK